MDEVDLVLTYPVLNRDRIDLGFAELIQSHVDCRSVHFEYRR